MSSPQHRSTDADSDGAADPGPAERLPPEVSAEDDAHAEEEGQVEPTVVPRPGAPSQSMGPREED